MLVLWEHREMSVKELGKQLLLDSGIFTLLLKRMEEIGLVVRTRLQEDECVVLITLTKKGEQLKTKAVGILDSLKNSVGFNEQDYKEFMVLVSQLLKFKKLKQ